MKNFLNFWPFLSRHFSTLLLVGLFGIIMSGCQSGAVVLVKYLFDKVFAAKDETMITLIPLGFVVLYIFNGIARYFHLYLIRYLSDVIATDLRQDMKTKLVQFNIGFHHNYEGGTGGLLSRTLNDVSILQSGIAMVADILREPFLAVFLIGYMFYEDWKLSFFCLLIVPILILFLRQIAKSLRKYGHKNQESLESITNLIKESLEGMKVIQSYNLEDYVKNRFKKAAEFFLAMRKKIISREEISGPISEILGAMLFAGIAIYMGQQILNDKATIGSFMSFVTAMGFMQKPIKKLQESFIKLQQSSVAAERLNSILYGLSVVPEISNPKSFPENWKKIEYKNLSFKYGEEWILKNINFKINRGEMVALVGESGSGKTTIISLLERFFDPNEGAILFDEIPISELKLKDLRDHMALVTQDVFLFNDTIENNIRMGKLNSSRDEIIYAAKLAHAHDFISSLPNGYDSRIGDCGNLLSGGERQRISIARAILKNAPLLILDEATSALDSASEIEVQKGLEELLKGKTSLIIAHRLSTIQKSSRILVIKEGVILEEGTHRELLELKGEYKKFHSLQMVDNS